MSASADPVLTASEQWHLLLWMVAHPHALDEDTDWPLRRARGRTVHGKRWRPWRRWLLPAIVALALDVATGP